MANTYTQFYIHSVFGYSNYLMLLEFPMMQNMFFALRAKPGTCRLDEALYSRGLYGSTDISALRAEHIKLQTLRLCVRNLKKALRAETFVELK
jgi:hypothetical protein